MFAIEILLENNKIINVRLKVIGEFTVFLSNIQNRFFKPFIILFFQTVERGFDHEEKAQTGHEIAYQHEHVEVPVGVPPIGVDVEDHSAQAVEHEARAVAQRPQSASNGFVDVRKGHHEVDVVS